MKDQIPFLQVKGVWKEFPGVVALKNVSLDCHLGQILGLIGENGAGKSTLMKILAGSYQPSAGEIIIASQKQCLESPAVAKKMGISMVYQDTRLVPDLTVMQNIWLGHEIMKRGFHQDFNLMWEKSLSLLERFEININPKTFVKELSFAERQLVEIVKALSRQTKLLILDEPTSALNMTEVDKLFQILAELRQQNTNILFVSHKISEVLKLCDRIAVLKDGELVGEVASKDANTDLLVRMMVGREIQHFFGTDFAMKPFTEKILQVCHLSSAGHFDDVSFTITKGEIVGIYGIEGNGQREIIRTIAGLLPATGGEIMVQSQRCLIKTPQDAIKAGISYLSYDRRGESIFLPLSIKENIGIPNLKKTSIFGLLSRKLETELASRSVDQLKVVHSSLRQSIEQLSGGNQQKVAFAGRQIQNPAVFIFDEPTVGVDVGSKSEIYTLIKKMASEGVPSLVLSSDLPEVIGLCDRILVVCEGKIEREILKSEASEEAVVAAAVIRSSPTKAIPRNQAMKQKITFRFGAGLSSLIIGALIFAIGLLGFFNSPYFLGLRNLSNLALQLVPIGLVVLGQAFVILLGGIDLSVGPLMSLITAIASFTVVGQHPEMGVIFCLVIGIMAGMINGLSITVLKLPDIVATLATYTVFQGVALIVRPTGGGEVSYPFMNVVNFQVWRYLPVAFLGLVGLYVVAEYILRRTRTGNRLYATGSHAEAAFLAGVNIRKIRFFTYVLCGLFASLAGLALAARIGTGDPQAGTSFTMSSITAVVLGGISLIGGRGTASGALLGGLLIVIMQNVLNLLHVSAYFQYVWVGVLMLLAVTIYNIPEIISKRNMP